MLTAVCSQVLMLVLLNQLQCELQTLSIAMLLVALSLRTPVVRILADSHLVLRLSSVLTSLISSRVLNKLDSLLLKVPLILTQPKIKSSKEQKRRLLINAKPRNCMENLLLHLELAQREMVD